MAADGLSRHQRHGAGFLSELPQPLQRRQQQNHHIRYVNNLEDKPSWGGADTPEELLAMRVMFPIAIRASEILNVDADLRPKWKEVGQRYPARSRCA